MPNPIAPGPDQRIYRPAELNQEARLHLEAGFPRLWLQAEISNLSRPASGHLYFTLKDEKAQIRCALFRSRALTLALRPANGQQVLVRGRLSLYEARGDYQLIVDQLLEAGAGALQQAFAALKDKLAGEGLFDAAGKAPIPAWPRRIAVVTSPSGAAIRDVLHVLAKRWPLAEVRIYPSAVQGDNAPDELIRALLAADGHGFAEVILLVRGGGSIEDLWAFNDERLARSIAAVNTPLISGIGHETDFTIADFVADLRAPTPSAAAAAATPDREEFVRRLGQINRRLKRQADEHLTRREQAIDYLDRRLHSRHPAQRLLAIEQLEAHLKRRARQAMDRQLKLRKQLLDNLVARLAPRLAHSALERRSQRLDQAMRRLTGAVRLALERYNNRLAELNRALDAVSPLRVLSRGYAVVRDHDDHALTQARQFTPNQNIRLILHRFEVRARVTDSPQQQGQ